MKEHGFGIIGCGMIAEFHTRAINEIPTARVVAAWSRSPANGAKSPGRYSIQLGIQVRNAFNHVNPGSPIAILSSPFFGQALQSTYNASAHRRVELSARFSF